MGTEQDFQRWLHERRMLFERWGLYLVANSILLFGFLQAIDVELDTFVASLGLLMCIVIALDVGIVPGRLEKLEKELDLQDFYKRKFISRKRWQFLLVLVLFVAWLYLFLYSMGVISS